MLRRVRCACPLAVQGQYSLQVTAKDAGEQELMCVVVDFELVPPSSLSSAVGSLLGRLSGSGDKGRKSLRTAAA